MKKCSCKVISGKIRNILQSKKGESTWKFYIPLSRKNGVKGSFKKYIVIKFNKDLKEKVE